MANRKGRMKKPQPRLADFQRTVSFDVRERERERESELVLKLNRAFLLLLDLILHTQYYGVVCAAIMFTRRSSLLSNPKHVTGVLSRKDRDSSSPAPHPPALKQIPLLEARSCLRKEGGW
jgi:hypothetical protein